MSFPIELYIELKDRMYEEDFGDDIDGRLGATLRAMISRLR